ncbi:hypothetical protein EYB26_008181 [Talaromyces marneffei]|uniref:uncharacterized protein n=1 Tax=Talaromyces marneffei TaxID=37727 RepID=UPI0012A89237|nr:uncharacterized protein EYB26_008181 [Talaromyces marneffei]QGA20477.1 hypothetical protein EYB26_008181 [Talaromyces marneffei]
MADKRIIGLAPTGSFDTFTFGSATSFASLNDLSRSLGAASSLPAATEDDTTKFPCSQDNNVFNANRTRTASVSLQQLKKPLAWYDQVHPIPYPSSPSNIFKQEPLDDEWRCDEEAEGESEDENDNDEDDEQGNGEDEEDAPVDSIESDEREKKRRKRNKPTLSCRECVGKKMRCDRGRPHCLSCIRRGTECIYRIKADTHEESLRKPTTRRKYQPRVSKQQPQPQQAQPQQQQRKQSSSDYDDSPTSSAGSKPALFTSQDGSDLLLSNPPYSDIGSATTTIFGISSDYPFSNYWTQNGGVAEVLKVFPKKEQADILVSVFFNAVDPVYPLISRERFYIDYEGFWELDDNQKPHVDTDFLALAFMVLAMGTQFLQTPGAPGQLQGAADFYSSACYQSMRLYSYLNRTSVRCLQAMVFMTYFLMNSGRASDGWAFSGTLVRQATAYGINREPTLFGAKFNAFQILERRRLWHGIVCQDSFMSMSLGLPPVTMYGDVGVATPQRDDDDSSYSIAEAGGNEHANEDFSNEIGHFDTGYVQSMYNLALLARDTLVQARSLSTPIAPNRRQRDKLMEAFRATYRTFPDEFRAWDATSIATLAGQGRKRLVRQIMFLTGLYWHCVTLIQCEGLEESEVQEKQWVKAMRKFKGPSNVEKYTKGTLDAACESIRAFFVIHDVLGGESSVWWSFCHRAFATSIMVAHLLKKRDTARGRRDSIDANSIKVSSHNRRSFSLDPLWERARIDLERMLEILMVPANAGDQTAKTRVEVLSSYLR